MVEFNKDWLKMSNRRIINSIHLVIGCGMGDEYIVGKNEVTEINTNTPFVLKYKE